MSTDHICERCWIEPVELWWIKDEEQWWCEVCKNLHEKKEETKE